MFSTATKNQRETRRLPEKKKPHSSRGKQKYQARSLSLANASLLPYPHRAFLRVDGNQKGITIGVGEVVAHPGSSAFERAVQLEPVVVLSSKELHVTQYDTLAIGTRFALQPHRK